MADITADTWSWSSTAASNSPSGSTAVGTNLDDNLRAIQAAVRAALEPLTSVAGTNTITASMAGLTAYVSGLTFRFIPANSNTGATTINVNSIGAKNVFAIGAACVGGEIVSGCPVILQYDGTQFNIVASAGLIYPFGSALIKQLTKAPTRQVFTSGSGTYTTPSGATRIYVRLIGGGAGGAGSGSSAGAGGDGGNTTFGTLTAAKGTGGSGVTPGAGGSGTNGDINITGGSGGRASGTANTYGGIGGSSVFGGAGAPGAGPSNTTGSAGVANTGAGGGGAGCTTTVGSGAGGGAGAYVEKLITSPSATYSYAVGAGGSAGSAGTSGDSGGAGGAGIIIVDEFYN